MKRAAMVIAMLGISAWSLGLSSDRAAEQNPQAGQAGPAAQGKRPPRAKTQPEYAAYNSAVALTDPAAAEKAADDFATRFPDSELRALVYRFAMHSYQQAHNTAKVLEMARKALSYDPDEPECLVGMAEGLVEFSRNNDPDKDNHIAEAKKDAERALVTIDTDIPAGGEHADKIAQLKLYLRSEVYEILGNISFEAQAWKEAEIDLRKSIDVYPQDPDPFAIFRLAVALDHQERFTEALKFCQRAVDLTKEDSDLGKAARVERDQLTTLMGASAPAQNSPPPKAQDPAPPK